MEMVMERPDTQHRDSVDSSCDEREERLPQQIYFNTKKEDREREKNLQKRLGELQTQIQRLERRIALLRTENDTLRKKQDDHRPLEDKIKTLKKRNAELASIARRLEEKAKTLQQENSRVRPKSTGVDDQNAEVEQVKRLYARQRAKELAEHAKVVLSKEEEVNELRGKCQQLANKLGNGELLHPQNAPQFEEKEELVNIIKQAAKERLQLEQQLAHVKKREKGDGSEDPAVIQETTESLAANEKQRQELAEANEILHSEIQKLEKALEKAEQLEASLSEKTKECNDLTEKLQQERGHKQRLEKELKSVTAQNTQLTQEVKNLQEKVKDVDEISEECTNLKSGLTVAQKEREAAQDEVNHLNKRVRSLENLVRDLQETAEKAGHLEHERQAALQQLQETKTQINSLQKSLSEGEATHQQEVNKLSKRVAELEEKRRLEEEKREDLSQEVVRLKKEAEEKQLALEAAEQLGREAYERERERNAALAKSNTEQEVVSDRKAGMDRRANRNQSDAPPGGESFLSSWAQNGPIQVYIAKYNYEPFEYSPNENPEAELPLSAGDYVLVVGEMDEDGFFDGELIDGRQGLVPSNFIEKVEDEDLAEFHAALLEAGHKDYSNSSTATSVGLNRTTASEDSIVNNNNNNTSTSNNNLVGMEMNSGDNRDKLDLRNGSEDIEEFNSDLEDIAEIDEETASINSHNLANGASTNNKLPPCPRGLSLDRQLSNSLLISWKEPEHVAGLEVQSYHVLLDGLLKTSVKSSERTKALLECVDASDVHRVCVQCLSNRGQSKDAQCTMLVGKDIYPKPSDLKLSHLSPTSAILSWLPGSSNYQHSILLNGKEVRTVKPGTFRYTLTGLSPGAPHQVTLIAKSISGTLNEEKSKKWVENVSASIKFFTPEAGCPEAPLNVQVEHGPQAGTVLLTWLPVTINASGVSNGSVVSGYHIMSEGRKVKAVSGATADHVILSSEDFQGRVPGHLSVRTISTSGIESSSSDTVSIPAYMTKELEQEAVKAEKPLKSKPFGVNASIASEPYSDTSSSELSDIPEVEEELVCSNDSNLNELGKPLANQLISSSQVKKESPRPSPRKGINQKQGPHEFHSQKPSADASSNLLTTPKRVVPAIEITRDSSSDKGASLDEETDRESSPSRHASKTHSPEGSIGSGNRNDPAKRSAFRQVDQRDHGKDTNVDQPTSSTPDPNGGQAVEEADFQQSKHSKLNHSNSKDKSLDQNKGHIKDIAASPPTSSLEDVGGDTDSISGEITSVVVDANSVRLFIALFDYDPETMSPNLESIEEELPFREGQILKVYGDKDADGFYKGECQGRIGYVPCNMVSEVQIDDPELVEQLLKESMEMELKGKTASSHTPTNEEPQIPLTPNGIPAVPRENKSSVRKMVAMYDYDPQELSPNVDAELELSFKTGDIIYIHGDMDEDGFYTGEISGRKGLVPSNFLQPAPTSDEEGVETDSITSATKSRSGESIATSPKGHNSHNSFLNNQHSYDTDSKEVKKKTSFSMIEISQEDADQVDSFTASSPTEDDKPKKKAGFFSKSKNIFKKLTR